MIRARLCGETDRFVIAALEKKGLKPTADADLYTWLRRVTFDLTGLPPMPCVFRFGTDTDQYDDYQIILATGRPTP